jgi:hypothetical protein
MCAACAHQVSVTAGTIFQDTRTPLTLWFRAIWLASVVAAQLGRTASRPQATHRVLRIGESNFQ